MLGTIADYIARTNLFNFIIFASIIAYIFVKLDVMGMLERGKDEVADSVNSSTEAKETSETNLKTIQDKLSKLGEEIDNIIKTSGYNADIVGEKIIDDANKSTLVIKENSEKLVENKTQLLKNELLKLASVASVEIAKNHIIDELNNNKDLHNKLIDESVDALNYVKE